MLPIALSPDKAHLVQHCNSERSAEGEKSLMQWHWPATPEMGSACGSALDVALHAQESAVDSIHTITAEQMYRSGQAPCDCPPHPKHQPCSSDNTVAYGCAMPIWSNPRNSSKLQYNASTFSIIHTPGSACTRQPSLRALARGDQLPAMA